MPTQACMEQTPPARLAGGPEAALRPRRSAVVRALDDLKLGRRLPELVRILAGRWNLDPAMHPARAVLDGREPQDRAGREVGQAADEHELIVELVAQLAAAPADLLDAFGELAAEVVIRPRIL